MAGRRAGRTRRDRPHHHHYCTYDYNCKFDRPYPNHNSISNWIVPEYWTCRVPFGTWWTRFLVHRATRKRKTTTRRSERHVLPWKWCKTKRQLWITFAAKLPSFKTLWLYVIHKLDIERGMYCRKGQAVFGCFTSTSSFSALLFITHHHVTCRKISHGKARF